MPRGVYERRSAQQKTAGKGKVTAKVKAKAAPKAKSKAPAKAKLAAAPVQLTSVVTTPAAQLAEPKPEAKPEPQFSTQDFRRSIDDMEPALLRAYARRIGIKQRDVDGLSEVRLRQNCKAQVLEALGD